ncbi:MAG: dihydropteroate synthase [Anaerolineales bacterium]|nr:dihydropteroate synthase [Anaerolineales bacterium]
MSMLLQGTGEPILAAPTDPVRMIGERINPSGRKRLRQALQEGEWGYVINEAVLQVEAGANILDVNVGGRGIDEAEVLPEAVKRISEAVSIPLSIDTRVPAALEAALKACPGRPLVNSIGGEDKILANNLPIIADFKVPVIVLCMGQEGIPDNADDRLRIAHKVVDICVQAGIAEEDILLDPLVMTVGADGQAARVTLETTRRLREEFPRNNITGGASNVSFGMPLRADLNAHFLSTAYTLGMNMPITDPTESKIRYALSAGNIFLGRDIKTRTYMRTYRPKVTE